VIDPGDLRESVTLRTRSTTQGATGEPAWSWSSIGSRRASVEPLSGAERVSAEQRQARYSTRFRVRRDSLTATVAPQDRITWRSRTFDIVAILEDGYGREWLVIVADELVGEAAP
jgi:SPP1 family predicted phage head-tail adaptor